MNETKVKRGQHIFDIALQMDGNINRAIDIVFLNLKMPNEILLLGEVLKLPSTLSNIQNYSSEADTLIESCEIESGFKIDIPGDTNFYNAALIDEAKDCYKKYYNDIYEKVTLLNEEEKTILLSLYGTFDLPPLPESPPYVPPVTYAPYPQTTGRKVIIIDDAPTGHGLIIKNTFLAEYPEFDDTLIEIRPLSTQNETFDTTEVAIVIKSYGGVLGNDDFATSILKPAGVLMFMPLGSNSSVEITLPRFLEAIIVSSSTADGTSNNTAFGFGLHFIDYDENIGGDTTEESSYSNARVAAKFMKIYDIINAQITTNWDEIITAAIQNANNYYDQYEYSTKVGFGIIDVDATVNQLITNN